MRSFTQGLGRNPANIEPVGGPDEGERPLRRVKKLNSDVGKLCAIERIIFVQSVHGKLVQTDGESEFELKLVPRVPRRLFEWAFPSLLRFMISRPAHQTRFVRNHRTRFAYLNRC